MKGIIQFFHRVANGRHNRKFIALENKKGALLDNVESILKENYLANGTQR